MSRIDRRSMLKAMAATAAGAAASATGVERAFGAGVPLSVNPNNPFDTSSTLRQPSSIRTALAAGAKSLNYMGQEFKPLDSTLTYTGGASPGAIQAVAGTPGASYYRASVDLPNDVVVTQVLFDLIVNDANPANVWFNAYNPESGAFGPLNHTTVSTMSASVQTVDMAIAPQTIDAVNLAYALYWFPGTNGSTHQLYGARVGWTLDPGITLFPDPRRIVSGDLTPFVSGTSYGPFDATVKAGGAIASGVPKGATAAFCAVQSYTPGVLTLYPDGAADPGIANYSGTGNLGTSLNMVYMMVPLSAQGKFRIHSYITGKCYVDAWGYVV